jgi:hypothetical protein
VTGQATYTIPGGNPFVGVSGADEVWAYGLRNPWRYSFDRLGNGALWLGDVGQGDWEEVEPIVAGGNYGWDCYEGNAPLKRRMCRWHVPVSARGLRPRRRLRGHRWLRVPRRAVPELAGWYIYGDYCSGKSGP